MPWTEGQRQCWSWRHKWVSDPQRDILVDTPTAWTFPKVCTRCGAKKIDHQEKSIQQVIAESRDQRRGAEQVTGPNDR